MMAGPTCCSCGECLPALDPRTGQPSPGEPDPRNHCRLYHNRGDGKFEDAAESASISGTLVTEGTG